MTFLASPWNIYENGGITLRQTVLKLAFAEPLSYNHESDCRSAKTTFPFKVLAGFSTQKCEMVDLSVDELNHLFRVFEEWETHLAQYDLDDLRCGDEHNRQ